MTGTDERSDAYTLRALELKQTGHTLAEIADKVAQEFNLVRVPSLTAVVKWINRKSDEVGRGIEELQELRWHERIEQYKMLEAMKRKWFIIATASEMEIQRWKFEEGSLQPFMDENATKEQIEATKAVVAIMKRQASLLGLDIEKEIAKKATEGEGPGTVQDLQVWLINQINLNGAHGAPIDIQTQKLELKAGVPELAALDENAV